MKKFFSLVLALVMALSLTTVAWGVTDVSDLTGLEAAFAVDETEITLTGAIVADGTDVTINPDYAVTITTSVVDAFVAKNGATLTLGENVTINSTTSVLYANGGTIIVDGATIQSASTKYNLVAVENGGTFTMYDGLVSYDCIGSDGKGRDTIYVGDGGGTVNVYGGEVYGAKGSAIGIATAGGTINISGGTVSTGAAGIDAAVFGYSGTINVSGDATITNTNPANTGAALVAAGAAVTVSGGNVQSVGITPDTAGTLTITGGTFGDDSAEDYLANGYELVSDGASGYVVVAESNNSWNALYGKTTGLGATIGAVTLEYYKAVAPIYNDDGIVTNQPSIAYYLCPELAGTTYLVEVTSLGAADIVVYNDVDGRSVFKYLDIVDNVEYLGNGVPFTNFGKACDQYKDANYDKTAAYYTFQNDVFKAVEFSPVALMVNGKLVPVQPATGAFVEHIASYTYNDKFEVTAVKCGVCGKPATIVPNYASLPDGVTGYGPINTSMYYYWGAATVSTDKTVTSAETFDAGIAMYVGMSVLAATGSAVVIGKKKD